MYDIVFLSFLAPALKDGATDLFHSIIFASLSASSPFCGVVRLDRVGKSGYPLPVKYPIFLDNPHQN